MPESLLAGRSAAVLTASDRCAAGLQEDRSGPALRELLENCGAAKVQTVLSSDDLPNLILQLQHLVDERTQLILTTGGTGMSPRDNTPEATLAVCQRLVPGLSEMMRLKGQLETPFAVLSRGICAIAGGSLVINLPGNTAGAVSGLRLLLPLLPHALDLISGKTGHPATEA